MKKILIIGFSIIYILTVYFSKGPIEKDLSERSLAALHQADVSMDSLHFDGRDAYLTGVVASEELKTQSELIVSQVYGVRTVNNQLQVKIISNILPIDQSKQDKEFLSNQIIHFEYNSSNVDTKYNQILDQIAEKINSYDTLTTIIVGHTDNIGNSTYNNLLSKRRADAVKQYLHKRGVAEDQIVIRGMGFSQPVASNHSSEGRKKNRRVEFKF
jgi:OOP family OmpA-OmpF porin